MVEIDAERGFQAFKADGEERVAVTVGIEAPYHDYLNGDHEVTFRRDDTGEMVLVGHVLPEPLEKVTAEGGYAVLKAAYFGAVERVEHAGYEVSTAP